MALDREIGAEAAQKAQSARTDATTQEHDHLGRVSEAAAAMLQRLNAMDSELSTLIDGLRTGVNRLNADLRLLEGQFDGVRDSLGPRARFETEPLPSAAGPLTGDGAGAPTTETEADADPEPGAAAGPEGDADTEGARLVALDMALNGTPRDETDRYLSANFQLDDRVTLLDAVYASVQG